MYPKTILVTGACRGVGLEFVRQLLKLHEPPHHVFAACRAPQEAKALKRLAHESPAVKIVKLDYDDLGTVQPVADAVAQETGDLGLNLLINNAAVYQKDSLPDISPERMRYSYEVNVVGPLMLTQALLPHLKTAAALYKDSPRMSCSHAAVVNISSELGSISASDTGRKYPYRCSKTAVNMMTKLLANDLKDDRILVMCLCPGKVQTNEVAGVPFSHQLSIEGMLDVMARMDQNNTGSFWKFSGKTLRW